MSTYLMFAGTSYKHRGGALDFVCTLPDNEPGTVAKALQGRPDILVPEVPDWIQVMRIDEGDPRSNGIRSWQTDVRSAKAAPMDVPSFKSADIVVPLPLQSWMDPEDQEWLALNLSSYR